MNRQQKEKVVEILKNSFETSQASFLVGYKGLNVAQVLKLRKQLRSQGASFKVAKVTLMKRVAHDLPAIGDLVPFLKIKLLLYLLNMNLPLLQRFYMNLQRNTNNYPYLVAVWIQ